MDSLAPQWSLLCIPILDNFHSHCIGRIGDRIVDFFFCRNAAIFAVIGRHDAVGHCTNTSGSQSHATDHRFNSYLKIELALRISAGNSDVRSEICPLSRIGISDWTEMALNFDRKVILSFAMLYKKGIMSTHPSSSHRGRIIRPAVPLHRQCTHLRTGRTQLWVESGRKY